MSEPTEDELQAFIEDVEFLMPFMHMWPSRRRIWPLFPTRLEASCDKMAW
jgi:hypothetical protein